jgi:chromosome partitioning protein
MRLIAVINQKGGVGKTTTTVNLAHALALSGKSVTLMDLDPQGHLAASFGHYDRDSLGVDDILMGNQSVAECLVSVREKIDLVPAGCELGQVERLLNGSARKGMRLSESLNGQLQNRDIVLLDCPPASDFLVVNALACAQEVLIPVAGDYMSLQGLSYLMGTFKNMEKMMKRKIKRWIVLTRYHKRRRLPDEIMAKLQEYFPGQVLATRVREAAALAECPSFGKTIFEYRKRSNGANDYRELADDLIYKRTIQ